MKKVSNRTKKFMTNEAYTAAVFTARHSGLTKILKFLAKGSKVKSNPATVQLLAARTNLF